ncbi:Fc.00g062680.m01.CDS01 [Cosmosporella sp. VM-42]
MRSYAHSLNGMERTLPPENEFLYRTKPLPPPPLPPKDAPRSNQSLTTAPRTPHGRKGSDRLPQRPLPLVLPPSQAYIGRMSLPTSPSFTSITGRRSSQKVHQLTGHDVGSNDFLPFRRSQFQFSSASPTDSSSNYSQSFDGPIFEEEIPRYSESSAPPPLDPDCDGMSSKRSSGAPISPQCIQFNTPSTRKPTLSHYNSAPGALDHAHGLHVSFLDDISWRGSRSYTYFSDNETADEYHKITSDLATLPERESIYNKSPLFTHTQSSISRRLSFSAKALFSRRREPLSSLDSNRASFASGHHPRKTQYPPSVHPLSIESNMTSLPHSVYETDEEEDEADDHHVREAIKGYFARRSEDRLSTEPIMHRPLPPPRPGRPETTGVFAKTGGQVKELFSGARNGMKSLHTSRAEKRRNQLRSQIRVIPEGTTDDNYI